MKKKLAFILALVMVLCLCAACGDTNGHNAADPGMEAVTSAVNAAADSDIMQSIPASYMANTMKISPDSYSEGFAKISKIGINIDEYGVFKSEDPEALRDALEAYLEYREEIWMDEYLPQEHPKLENAEVWVVGDYVMYAILDAETLQSTETAFKGCFEG